MSEAQLQIQNVEFLFTMGAPITTAEHKARMIGNIESLGVQPGYLETRRQDALGLLEELETKG